MPVRLNGSTSGYVELAAPATAGSTSLTLPTDSVQPGLVLVSPTSLTVSGGSATASGGQVTFTNVGTVSLNGVFTSSYDNYRILYYTTAFSAASDYIDIRLRTSGTDASGSNYYAPRSYWGGSSGSDNLVTTSFRIGYGYSAYPTASHGEMDMIRPYAAEFTRITYTGSYLTSGGSPYGYVGSGAHNVATAYDGISLYVASGTMSGVIRVYGYRNLLTS